MILAAHQPQFAPWLGYIDKLDAADVFVLLDTVQFKKNEWQNRNRVKGPGGAQWLTVPVSFRFGDPIRAVRLAPDPRWRRRHLRTLETCYRRAAHFDAVFALYEGAVAEPGDRLAGLNVRLLRAVVGALGITTRLVLASELDPLPADRDGRLVELCRRFGAETYLAGAGGLAYMDLDVYERAGVEVRFQDYRHPTYPQLFGPFEPRLSVLDLLFNGLPDALDVVRSGRRLLDRDEALAGAGGSGAGEPSRGTP